MEIIFENMTIPPIWIAWFGRILPYELWQVEIRRLLAQSELKEIQF